MTNAEIKQVLNEKMELMERHYKNRLITEEVWKEVLIMDNYYKKIVKNYAFALRQRQKQIEETYDPRSRKKSNEI